MSRSFATTVPVAHALWPVAEAELQEKLEWQAAEGNALQELMLRTKDASLKLAGTLSAAQLAAKASRQASVVNKFLIDQGFTLQLQDRGAASMIYAASVMKLLGNWLKRGTTDYHLPKIDKPAFRLPADGLKHFIYKGNPVIVVPTSGGFSFLVTRPTGVQGFEMLEDWTGILRGMKPSSGNGLILPMASIDETKVDVSKLEGMSTPGLSPWVIQEALMAAKYGLTPVSVKFEAAFAFSARSLGISKGKEPEAGDYEADHDHYFALVKSGHWLPLAAGFVSADELADEVVV